MTLLVNLDDKDQVLYVVSEFFCRGITSQAKTTITSSDINEVIEIYASEDEEVIDNWFDEYESYDKAVLLQTLVNDKELLDGLLVNGRVGVALEESSTGIGITKELAYQAFYELNEGELVDGWK